jgi:hypothetical protein
MLPTESSPPSAMLVRTAQVSGFATDKIRAIIERAGVD